MVRLRAFWATLVGRAREVAGANLTPRDIGWAVAMGVFIGVLPLYGLHLPICIVLARQLRLNQVLTYAAAQISLPFFAPFLIVAEIEVGQWLRYGKADPADPDTVPTGLSLLQEAPDLFLSCLLGSLVIGAVAAPLLGGIAALAARWRSAGRVPA